MADAQMADAADGKLKDLKISETKKSKKDGAPKKAAKPQQQKKKVGLSTDLGA
jgi:prolyl-tRNA synthetase